MEHEKKIPKASEILHLYSDECDGKPRTPFIVTPTPMGDNYYHNLWKKAYETSKDLPPFLKKDWPSEKELKDQYLQQPNPELKANTDWGKGVIEPTGNELYNLYRTRQKALRNLQDADQKIKDYFKRQEDEKNKMGPRN